MQISAAAINARMVSKLAILPLIPRNAEIIGLILSPKIQPSAIKTKIAKVIIRERFNSIFSNDQSKLTEKFGLNTIYSVAIINGNKISIIGKPYFNQSAKVRFN